MKTFEQFWQEVTSGVRINNPAEAQNMATTKELCQIVWDARGCLPMTPQPVSEKIAVILLLALAIVGAASVFARTFLKL